MSDITTLGALQNEKGTNPSCLLCCASFEARCLSVPRAFSKGRFSEFVVFQGQSSSEKMEEHAQILSKLEIADERQVRQVSIDSPLFMANTFFSLMGELTSKHGILDLTVDITTFTRESILILMRTLHSYSGMLSKVRILYNPAKKMDNDWLSRGVKQIRSVLGYAGSFDLNRPLHLVVLTGFELERAVATIEEYEPTIVSVGLGGEDASIRPEFYEKNKHFANELVKLYGSHHIKTFTFSLRNPTSCKDAITGHLRTSESANVVIAPLCNKISTVGAALVGLEREDVQICYTQPIEYNVADYSEPDTTVYAIDVSLGTAPRMGSNSY